MRPPKWLIPPLVRLALGSTKGRELKLPGALNALEKSVILWPAEPDEAAKAIASGIKRALGKKIRAILSFSGEVPFPGIELIRLDKSDIGFLGYPKRSAVRKLEAFGASIDLSPEFELNLSVLPLWADIKLRIGRDSLFAGSAYNIIISGKTGMEIETLLNAKECGSYEKAI